MHSVWVLRDSSSVTFVSWDNPLVASSCWETGRGLSGLMVAQFTDRWPGASCGHKRRPCRVLGAPRLLNAQPAFHAVKLADPPSSCEHLGQSYVGSRWLSWLGLRVLAGSPNACLANAICGTEESISSRTLNSCMRCVRDHVGCYPSILRGSNICACW